MNKFNSWHSYYQNRQPDISNILLHWQYLLRIIWYRPGKLLEVGCGPAEHSLFLKKHIPSIQLSLLDQDKKLLESVVNNHPHQVTAKFVADLTSVSSLRKLPVYDLAISQGLMEHFSNRQFSQVIRNLSGHTKKYLFSVPSDQYPNRDFGNEILRSKADIEAILSQIPGIKYAVTPYIDIGFRTKLISLQSKKIHWLRIPGYLLSCSNHLLIDITYQ